MIKLIKLKVEGFQNLLGPVKVNFRTSGVRVIKGLNGEGKTTLLSSIAWVLYGKPLKAKSTIETWEHKRDDDYLGTKVSITFRKDDLEYRVIRCKDYTGPVMGKIGRNRLILMEGNEEYTKYRTKNELQAYLTMLIGYDFELFTNATIFPQKITRFIELKGAQRKEILEEIFDISYITQGYKIAKKQSQELAEAVNELEHAVVKTEVIIDEKTESKGVLETLQEEKDNVIADLEDKLADKRHTLEQEPKKPVDLQQRLNTTILKDKKNPTYTSFKQLTAESNKAEARLTLKKREAKASEKALSDLKYGKKEDCNVCGQELDKKAKATSLAFHKDAMREALTSVKDLKNAISNFSKEIAKAQVIIDKVEDAKTKLADNLKALNVYRLAKKDYDNNLVNITNAEEEIENWKSTDYSDEIGGIQILIDEHTEKLRKQNTTLHKTRMSFNAMKFVADKVFSKTGFKAYLLELAIVEINSILETYTEKIGFRVELEIAENAYRDVQAIIFMGEYPVIYQDLSSGQGQLVNAAISLSLAEFMSSKGAMGFLALDEITTNLDPKNQEKIGAIVSSIGEQKEVWLITHSPDLVIPGAEIIYIAGEDKVIRTLTI